MSVNKKLVIESEVILNPRLLPNHRCYLHLDFYPHRPFFSWQKVGTVQLDKLKVMEESLQVFDTRTGKLYPIPIHNGDYIRAADIGQIAVPEAKYLNGEAKHMNGDTAPQIARPLRILDNGYQHTACMESSITYMYAINHLGLFIADLC